VCPASAADVSKAVLFARTNNLDLAVCCGGHATSGSSSTDGGICIDLSKLRHISVDAGARTVVAEGGCLWKDVDEAAARHGLATVGGTVNRNLNVPNRLGHFPR
jgi:FAD/FMN-containing dehydrogenase